MGLAIVPCLCVFLAAVSVSAQPRADQEAVRALPPAFSAAFDDHDRDALSRIMTEDVDFVTVG